MSNAREREKKNKLTVSQTNLYFGNNFNCLNGYSTFAHQSLMIKLLRIGATANGMKKNRNIQQQHQSTATASTTKYFIWSTDMVWLSGGAKIEQTLGIKFLMCDALSYAKGVLWFNFFYFLEVIFFWHWMFC